MKELTKRQVEEMLKKKGFDTGISWFYIQFKNKFEEEYIIDHIDLKDSYNNLINFLKRNKISEVLFFPEPDFDAKIWSQSEIPSAVVKIGELKDFLKNHVNTFTNCHVADKELKWIFTITHEDDFFISGSKELVKKFIKSFKGANIMSRAEVEAKWTNKKN